MLKIAIVGNIASGKSTVEKIIEELGYQVYDTDKIAHKILENSPEIINSFKNDDVFIDNKIDRKKLGALVFSNKEKLKLLESIIHPQVKKELKKIFSKTPTPVFVSVPQLFEAGFESMFDKIIYITAEENIRLERLMLRNNLSEIEAKIRISAQTETGKLKKSNFIIKNNSDLNNLRAQTIEILKKLNL